MMRNATGQRAGATFLTVILTVAVLTMSGVLTASAHGQSRRVVTGPVSNGQVGQPDQTAEMERLRAELRAEIDARIERSMNALRGELAEMIDAAIRDRAGAATAEAPRSDARIRFGAPGGMQRSFTVEGESIGRDQLMKLLREGGIEAGQIEGLPGAVVLGNQPGSGGYLGVNIGNADGDGVAILGAIEGTAAAKAGLREGDRIVAIDDVEMTDVETLAGYVSSRAPGDTVEIMLVRDGQEKIVEAVLGRRMNAPEMRGIQPGIVLPRPQPRTPEAEAEAVPAPSMPAPDTDAEAGARPWLGITIQNTEDESNGGVEVVGVTEGAPAAEAGVREGDRIVAIDGVRVEDVDGLADAIFSKGLGKKATLVLARGGDTRIVLVPLVARGEAERRESESAGAEDHAAEDAVEAPRESRPGFLGVYLADGEGGASVSDTIEDTAAADAGLQAGDVIASVNNQSVSGSNDLVEALRSFRAGDSITLTVLRDGGAMTKTVTLGARPDDMNPSSPSTRQNESVEAAEDEEEEIVEEEEIESVVEEEEPRGRGYLGVEVADLDAQTRLVLGLDEDEGLLVTRVIDETPAAMAGLRTNDVLVSGNSKATGSRDALVSILDEVGAGGTVKLSILRKGRAMELPVTLGTR